MAGRPQIAIVGPGNLGSALAIALRRAGYPIEIVLSRRTSSSVKRSRTLAREVGASLQTTLRVTNGRVIWFCVPDSQIARVSTQLAKNLKSAKGLIALHSSGALTSDELKGLQRKGARAASVHPLMTFVAGSQPSLSGVPFVIEGDAAAVRVARQIVRDLKGVTYSIRKYDKAAYHAWGAFVSPLLTSLLAASERVAKLAGLNQRSAQRRAIPILLQTLANYASFGAAGAFSGPIARGDVETVKRHLHVLKRVPSARRAYVVLAQAALHYLPARNKRELLSSLRGTRTGARGY
ncbi:MAG TPA: DUF2520 domain-containing protein [Candidatus Eisenbacteria bacterium]|nr:DUF2520 domain-containing protein [Candidatus Eisenbacteria bacterium]